MKWAADFETTTVIPVSVWLWAVSAVNDPNDFSYGENMQSFYDWMKKQKENPVIFFHNQKFDGMFLIYYMLKNGWEWKRPAEKGSCGETEFTSIVDENGQFFSIEIYFRRKGKRVKKASIYDSCKILPFALDKAAKNFGLNIRKLHIDYDAHNHGEPVTAEDIEYIEHDVKILAQLIQIFCDYGLTGHTIGSCAMTDYIKKSGLYKQMFPVLCGETDKALRAAYYGGWMFLNPDYAGYDVGAGVSLDCNSMYGSCMARFPMPYGEPVYFAGEYPHNKDYPLYVQFFYCQFHIKNDRLPFVQARNCPQFVPSEYLYESGGNLIRLAMTNIDFEMFRKYYEIDEIIFDGGYMFRCSDKLFRDWVAYWSDVKINAENSGNKSLRMIAKLMIVSLYGKFATNPEKKAVKPVMDMQKDCVRFIPELHKCTDIDGMQVYDELGDIVMTDIDRVRSYYIPVGIFTTAYARRETIEAAQKIHEDSIRETGKSRFIYAATDSLHLIGDEIPDFLDMDQQRTGAWKTENYFSHGKYLGVNRYIEVMRMPDGGEQLKIRCSGLPETQHGQITFENFNDDAVYEGRLRPKSVPGGVLLVREKFHMKRKRRR